MICDWNSANFEETTISNDTAYPSVIAYYNSQMTALPWSDAQRKFIIETINEIERLADYEIVRKIWTDL